MLKKLAALVLFCLIDFITSLILFMLKAYSSNEYAMIHERTNVLKI